MYAELIVLSILRCVCSAMLCYPGSYAAVCRLVLHESLSVHAHCPARVNFHLTTVSMIQGKEAFARAAVDVFQFACQGVGEMQMLRISHNNAGRNPDWHLQKVHTH